MSPNDRPDEPVDDLSRELARAAEAVTTGDSDELFASVQHRAAQRRRRRSSIIGVAAVGALVMSGVVVAQLVGDGSGDDRLVSAPADEPVDSAADEEVPDEASSSVDEPMESEANEGEPVPVPDEEEPVDGDVPAAVPSTEATDDAEASDGSTVTEAVPVEVRVVPSVVDDVDAGLADAEGSLDLVLFPWQDGVLSVATSYAPQPLPAELPEEMRDAFPPEVLELFPDGLPPTISEATQILQDAGLLDEVTAVLSENPEISDAIYSQPSPEPTRTVRFSSDGEEWTEVDAALPSGVDAWNGITSTGERLVAVRPVSGDGPDASVWGLPAMPVALEIHSSSDLVDWSVQTVPVPATATGGEVYVQSLAATESGFVLAFESVTDDPFDVFELLSPEMQERLQTGAFSYGQGDEGVAISLSDPDDPAETLETFTFTWEELGLDGPPPDDIRPSVHRYVGRWDGTAPTLVEQVPGGWSQISAVGDVFVETGPVAQWSADGLVWNPIELPGGDMVLSVAETGGGHAVLANDTSGSTTLYVGDLRSGEWSPVSSPDLPTRASVERFGDGVMLLVDYGGPQFEDPFADAVGSREFAEVDGYRYELESTWGDEPVATYRVIELASGAEIVSETTAEGAFGDQLFEHLEHGGPFGDSLQLLDPASGEVLVTIPYDVITREVVHPDGSVTDMSTVEMPAPPEGELVPEYWAVAFLDDGMVVQPLDLGSDPGMAFPVAAIGLDDVALIARSNGVITRVTSV